jgi:membrane-associated phospholipid phosphatase
MTISVAHTSKRRRNQTYEVGKSGLAGAGWHQRAECGGQRLRRSLATMSGAIGQAIGMDLRRIVAVVAALAGLVFIVLTIGVATGSGWVHSVDSAAFDLAADLRAPWLDHAARLITKLGLIAVVGPVLVAGAALLLVRRHLARAAALLLGCALEWAAVWVVKFAVDRPRPSNPLVSTSGASFPSAHAANSVGWFALALATGTLLSMRAGRVALITAGALLTLLVGLSRIYLRAHYLTDVLAGEALAVAMYAVALIVSLTWLAQPPESSARAASSLSTSDLSL